jgi:hypothetical protein
MNDDDRLCDSALAGALSHLLQRFANHALMRA